MFVLWFNFLKRNMGCIKSKYGEKVLDFIFFFNNNQRI